MVYEFSLTLHLVDIIGIVLGLIVTGAMIGWQLLPPPIDEEKEKLIDRLFQENVQLKLGLTSPKK